METKRETRTVDASDRPLGRLAAEIAVILRGKHRPNFRPNQDLGDFVVVKNIGKIKFTGKKLEKEKYRHHTGYAGGFRTVSMKKIFDENPAEVLRRAVWGMLPTNKLRPEQIKRLKFQ